MFSSALYKEKLVNIVRKGSEGAAEIKSMMTSFRNNPPEKINNCKVIRINDYELMETSDLLKGTVEKINMMKSDVLQFILADGSKISVRPSGTEPKIKFYFSVNTKLESADKFEETQDVLDKRIERDN